MINTSPWDVAHHLQTKDAIIAYLEAALEDGDPCLINAALADIARSEGLAKLSHDLELSPEIVGQESLDNNQLNFTNLTRTLQILGLRLQLADIRQEQQTSPSVVA